MERSAAYVADGCCKGVDLAPFLRPSSKLLQHQEPSPAQQYRVQRPGLLPLGWSRAMPALGKYCGPLL